MHKSQASYLGKCVHDIQNGKRLSVPEAKKAFTIILENKTSLAEFYWGALFSCIQTRKPEIEEIVGFVESVQEYESKIISNNSSKFVVPISQPIVAICGSGKDTWKTFNISTAASFIAASCGVCVFKPGSIATSSISGAIQILPHLGISIAKNLNQAVDAIKQTGIGIVKFSDFVPKYAQRYDGLFHHFHPLSYIIPAISIPIKLDGIVYGISNENINLSMSLIKQYGPKNIAVVTTKRNKDDYTDELLPFGESFFIAEIGSKNFNIRKSNPIPHNIQVISHGNSHKENAEKLKLSLSEGRESLLSQAAAMTAAGILIVGGVVNNLSEGYEVAVDAIQSGKAINKLKEYAKYSHDV
jgi:anthranilate phosphoribosyltransferase